MGEATIQQTFAERLRLLREAQGFSQKQMAAALNVSRSTYTRYENGSSAPSLELMRRLVQLLADNDPRYLMQLPIQENVSRSVLQPGITSEEQQLLLYFRTLSESQQADLLAAIRAGSMRNLAAEAGKES